MCRWIGRENNIFLVYDLFINISTIHHHYQIISVRNDSIDFDFPNLIFTLPYASK
jgi:hypothetical protein